MAGLGIKERFMIIAVTKAEETSLMVSMDGVTFAHALFPATASKQFGFTIMDSSFSSITIDTLLQTARGALPTHGSLYFSNSNGTYFKVRVLVSLICSWG